MFSRFDVIPGCPAGVYPEPMNTSGADLGDVGVHRFRVRSRGSRPGMTVNSGGLAQ
jgi:hypothetical protein